MIDLKSLAVGDEITLTTTVRVINLPDKDGDVRVTTIKGRSNPGFLYRGYADDYLPTHIKRAPRPIQVGDTVWSSGGSSYSVLALADGFALLRHANGQPAGRRLDTLAHNRPF